MMTSDVRRLVVALVVMTIATFAATTAMAQSRGAYCSRIAHDYAVRNSGGGAIIGIQCKSVMIWTVLGSATSLPSDALRGSFLGVAADASLGLGAGAKVLVGGNNKSVVLQPLSVQGQTVVNLVVGVSALKLGES